MRLSRIAGIAITALVTVAPPVLAQTQPQTKAPTRETSATQVFTGCLMKESDYRTAHKLGEGAVKGVGLGDEFVLVDVQTSPASAAPTASRPASTPAATASASTTTCADQGLAYRLTGSDEEKLKTLVGRKLEITGRLKQAADVAAGGTRPDAKLPAEVEIVSFRQAGDGPVSEPAATTPRPQATQPPPQSATPPVTPPPPPPSSAQTARPQPTTPATAPATQPAPADRPAERSELPRTASSSALVGLVGLLALGSGIALTVLRRRAL
jgi:hypothetical protein